MSEVFLLVLDGFFALKTQRLLMGKIYQPSNHACLLSRNRITEVLMTMVTLLLACQSLLFISEGVLCYNKLEL